MIDTAKKHKHHWFWSILAGWYLWRLYHGSGGNCKYVQKCARKFYYILKAISKNVLEPTQEKAPYPYPGQSFSKQGVDVK